MGSFLFYRTLLNFKTKMDIRKERNILIENPETKSFLADAFYPEADQKLPLLIFAHGYKGYKDWGTWGLMGEAFAKSGFFFVKFNFSHNGTTLDDPQNFGDLEAFGNNNYTKELSDYQKVIDYFSNHPNVDPDKIAIMGHSRGGGDTILQAQRDPKVKALITLAGVNNFASRFPKKDLFETYKEKGVFYVINGRTKQEMPHYWQFYEDFKAHENELDIQRAAQHLKKPCLIIHGTNDEAVKIKEAELLHQWIKGSELKIIEGADHVFGGREPWSDENLPEDLETVVKLSAEFLKTVL
ncbi:TPA: prolyl oligopeptidase family serine peptidase [Elizabethkingia meningoseptica]|nr:prolyl oligopeptidase family serine peptidase [Elizabethkingia meningoseptica]